MSTEAMKQVLEKIANVNAMDYEYQRWAREALAIAEAEKQEPVVINMGTPVEKLYTTLQQRKPLTFEQVEDCFPEGASVFEDAYGDYHTSPRWLHAFARAIETAHGIKENT